MPDPIRTPIYQRLVPIPIACFGGALLTDLAYWQSLNLQWANFSSWLLAGGLVVALIYVVTALAHFLRYRRLYWGRAVLVYCATGGIALVLAILDSFIHARDGYTSVVPTGLALSALAFLILLAAQFAAPVPGLEARRLHGEPA